MHKLPKTRIKAKATIVRACILSVLGYGTEGCYVPQACKKLVDKLDILQRRAARHLLATPQSTANETCTTDLGWETMQTNLDIRTIKYRSRIASAEAHTLLG